MAFLCQYLEIINYYCFSSEKFNKKGGEKYIRSESYITYIRRWCSFEFGAGAYVLRSRGGRQPYRASHTGVPASRSGKDEYLGENIRQEYLQLQRKVV